MAHKTSAGAKAHQGCDVKGKRRGLKVAAGEKVNQGQILIRQKGTVYIPGINVGIGRDHTLFAKAEGVVSFQTATGKKRGRKIVNVTKPAKTNSKLKTK